jgi:hypothetical protein
MRSVGPYQLGSKLAFALFAGFRALKIASSMHQKYIASAWRSHMDCSQHERLCYLGGLLVEIFFVQL